MARKPADQSVNKEDILTAAADVLRQRGYEAATMKDIAAAVNLTAASLYHHFKNKDTLLIAVLEAGLDFVISQIEPIVAADLPPAEKLRQMVRIHVLGVTNNTAVGAAMVFEMRALINVEAPGKNAKPSDREAYAQFCERRTAFFDRRDHFEALFAGVIRAGIANGDFAPLDVGIFTKMLLGAQNWVGLWYRPEGRLKGEQIADLMTEMLLRALQPGARG